MKLKLGLVCSLILEDLFDRFLIDFEVDLGSESVQNEVGNRVGNVIGKRRAKDGLIGANLGSKMASCWAENRRRLKAKKVWKREVKKRW